jgi:DNA-binding NarL/FixJ family response regulator
MIRIAIVDDHPVFREGTAALLDAEPDMSVVALVGNVGSALVALSDATVDVLVLDVRLPDGSGFDLLDQVTGMLHPPAVVVFTAYDYAQYAEAAIRLGAAGFVAKTAPTEELLTAIRVAASGGLLVGGHQRRQARRPFTAREHELVHLLADGLSNDEIAMRLGIGRKTVETHLRRLFAVYGVSSRTELATMALREGMLDVPG